MFGGGICEAASLVLYIIAAPQPATPEAEFRAGRFERAAAAYRRAIDQSPQSADDHCGLVRSLLRLNRVAEARGAAERASALLPGSAVVRSARGDVHFRSGEFAQAWRLYDLAAQSDQQCARAYLGLGRLQESASHYPSARQYYDKANELDSEDPEIVLHWARSRSELAALKAGLERYLTLATSELPETVHAAKSELEVLRTFGDRKACVPAQKTASGQIDLYRLTDGPSGQALGVRVSVNGRKPELFLVDTGASGVYVDRRTAQKAGLRPLVRTQTWGVGDSGPVVSTICQADEVRVGDYAVQNCPVNVLDRNMPQGVPGVLGTDVFARYLLTLDYPRLLLRLEPHPYYLDIQSEREGDLWSREPSLPKGLEHATPVRRFGHKLLVETTVNERKTGWFLLDTGASRNLISNEFAEGVGIVGGRAQVGLYGASGAIRDVRTIGPAVLAFGRIRQANFNMLGFDFAKLSQGTGAEVSGIIGYAVLQHLAITIDYVGGLVYFASSR